LSQEVRIVGVPADIPNVSFQKQIKSFTLWANLLSNNCKILKEKKIIIYGVIVMNLNCLNKVIWKGAFMRRDMYDKSLYYFFFLLVVQN
jgi:hypothetical protein